MTKYETPKDRAEEHRILSAFARHRGWEFEQLAPMYPLDGAFFQPDKKKVVTLVEAKRRYHDWGTYTTLFVDLGKLSLGFLYARMAGVPFYLCIGWDNKTGYIEVDRRTAQGLCTVEGRTDRDDVNDLEPVIHIPIIDFDFIGESR